MAKSITGVCPSCHEYRHLTRLSEAGARAHNVEGDDPVFCGVCSTGYALGRVFQPENAEETDGECEACEADGELVALNRRGRILFDVEDGVWCGACGTVTTPSDGEA